MEGEVSGLSELASDGTRLERRRLSWRIMNACISAQLVRGHSISTAIIKITTISIGNVRASICNVSAEIAMTTSTLRRPITIMSLDGLIEWMGLELETAPIF
jgi:hypothetical protein